jgi:lysophospholipase L1-like esterase
MSRYALFISLAINLLGVSLFCLAVSRLGGMKQLWMRWQHRGVPALYHHRIGHFEALPVQKGAVIFLGDSQTEQAEWHELADVSGMQVLNRGISGDHIQGVRNRIEEILRHEPAYIFLQIGINDLLAGTAPVQAVLALEQLIEVIQRRHPSGRLVVLGLPPVNSRVRVLSTNNEVITAFNQGLQRVAAQKNVPFLELYAPLSDGHGQLSMAFTEDGIHLNGSGYRVWRWVLDPWLPKMQ